jgi:hypothetical protein
LAQQPRNRGIGRGEKDLQRGTHLEKSTMVEDADTAAKPNGFIHVMRDEHKGLPELPL